MSRAFTKEDDAGEDLPERPVPDGPNYVTPRGLALLHATGRELIARRVNEVAAGGDLRPIDRDLRYLERRISSAVVIPVGSGDEVRFGAHVTIEDDTHQTKTFQIVGDDEARADANLLSWSSPLASAMFGSKAGATIEWDGPDTTVRAKVIRVEYRQPT